LEAESPDTILIHMLKRQLNAGLKRRYLYNRYLDHMCGLIIIYHEYFNHGYLHRIVVLNLQHIIIIIIIGVLITRA